MMKVGKEEVMGILAAVEYWAAVRDDDQEYERMIRDLSTISDLVTELEGVTAEVLERKDEKSPAPRLEVRWPDGCIHELDLRQALLDGEPRIMLDDRGATEGSVFILPFSLQDREAEVVGKA
jgi:seryl-tRNA(Sec) selenium transferase